MSVDLAYARAAIDTRPAQHQLATPVVRIHEDGRFAVHRPTGPPHLPHWSVTSRDGRHVWCWDGDVVGPGWSEAVVARADVARGGAA